MIKHIVFFKFKTTDDKAARMAAIKCELEKLPAVISELKELRVGININPAETWDLSLEALVNDMAALSAYANQPPCPPTHRPRNDCTLENRPRLRRL